MRWCSWLCSGSLVWLSLARSRRSVAQPSSRERKNALSGGAQSLSHTCQAARILPVCWTFALLDDRALGLGADGLRTRRRARLGWRRAAILSRHEHQALELRDQHTVLVEHPRMHLHGAAIGLRLRLLLLQHLRLAEQRVPVEDRRRVLELFGGQVGDRLA